MLQAGQKVILPAAGNLRAKVITPVGSSTENCYLINIYGDAYVCPEKELKPLPRRKYEPISW